MATTLSLLAVFLPVGFMGGIVGRFMSSFGLTSSFAIAVSLLVSFTLTPMLAARLIKRSDDAEEGPDREDYRTFRSRFKAVTFLSANRSYLHSHVDVVHGSSLGDCRGVSGGDPQHRAAVHVCRQKLFAG